MNSECALRIESTELDVRSRLLSLSGVSRYIAATASCTDCAFIHRREVVVDQPSLREAKLLLSDERSLERAAVQAFRCPRVGVDTK